jgi:phage terminase large subunit-like protein
VSEALNLMNALVLEDGRRWGEVARDFQRADAEAVLDEASETPNHLLTRPRGDSKTSDLGGLNLAAGLAQAPHRARMYALAADEKQGRLLLDALAGFVARTPELRSAVVIRESSVHFQRSHARLEVLAADQSSIWGLRPWFLTIDELGQWHTTAPPQRCYEAASSAVVKVPGARMVLLTTASDPAHWSKAIRDQALTDRLWNVHEVPGPPHWIDAKRLEGERRRLPESSFRRLFLNEWTSSEDRLADEEDLAACVDDEAAHAVPKAGTRYVLAVDIGVKHDATAAIIAHAERIPGAEFPRVVVDRVQTWVPSRLRPVKLSVVEAWVEEYARRYRAPVRFDPSQALHMMQRLKRAGVRCQEFTFSASSVAKIAVTLLTVIREHALALPDDPDLLDELRNVRLRESSPGVYRLDHDRNRHDDRAVALALAASYLVERPTAIAPLRGLTSFSRREERARAAASRSGQPVPRPRRDRDLPEGFTRTGAGTVLVDPAYDGEIVVPDGYRIAGRNRYLVRA